MMDLGSWGVWVEGRTLTAASLGYSQGHTKNTMNFDDVLFNHMTRFQSI